MSEFCPASWANTGSLKDSREALTAEGTATTGLTKSVIHLAKPGSTEITCIGKKEFRVCCSVVTKPIGLGVSVISLSLLE